LQNYLCAFLQEFAEFYLDGPHSGGP